MRHALILFNPSTFWPYYLRARFRGVGRCPHCNSNGEIGSELIGELVCCPECEDEFTAKRLRKKIQVYVNASNERINQKMIQLEKAKINNLLRRIPRLECDKEIVEESEEVKQFARPGVSSSMRSTTGRTRFTNCTSVAGVQAISSRTNRSSRKCRCGEV